MQEESMLFVFRSSSASPLSCWLSYLARFSLCSCCNQCLIPGTIHLYQFSMNSRLVIPRGYSEPSSRKPRIKETIFEVLKFTCLVLRIHIYSSSPRNLSISALSDIPNSIMKPSSCNFNRNLIYSLFLRQRINSMAHV